MERENEDFLERERQEQLKLEKERLEKERQEQLKLENERLERERITKLVMENRLFPNNSLFMIPSWSDLLGYPTLGTYAHHQVSKIVSDPVIFFSGYDYSIQMTKGTLHYLFGLGYYYLKFEIESGNYITDHKILTGLVLPDFVYDHMATSNNVTLEDDRDVIIAEKVIRVPVNLSNKSENHLTFIKGALMRNVFIPNKDIFLEMFDTLRNEESYQINKYGHMVLSAQWEAYDQILVSENINQNPYPQYLDSAAGLMGIEHGVDELLQETISPTNLSLIEYKIDNLKNVYVDIEFDPMYLFSILEKVSFALQSTAASSPVVTDLSSGEKKTKESIFASAEDRIYEFISWPIEFQRNIKMEDSTSGQVEQPIYLKQKEVQELDISDVKIPEYNQETFELRTMKAEKVDYKPLPSPPAVNIKDTFIYLKNVIEGHYDMRSIGSAFEIARETMRQIGVSATTTQQAKIWEMSKYANIYVKKAPDLGMPAKENAELIQKVNSWLFELEEEERLERERIEQARLEAERIRREKEEQLERERREKERIERECLEKEKLEKEKQLLEEQRKEIEALAKIKKQEEQVRQERLRLKQEQVERERMEKLKKQEEERIRLEAERMEKERMEKELIDKEKEELTRLKEERKAKEKEAKIEAKRKKKAEKQKKKIDKQKQKEQKRLDNL